MDFQEFDLFDSNNKKCFSLMQTIRSVLFKMYWALFQGVFYKNS